MTEATSYPEPVAILAPTDVIEVDVREDLRQGREPFTRIMDAREALPNGAVLVVRAIFEPAPLYGVMEGYGFDHVTEALGPEDWRVWFYTPPDSATETTTSKPHPGSAALPPQATEPEGDDATEGLVVLDVRNLEPPEPMVRTLEALENLPEDETLLQLNVRVPQFLLPQLDERGFDYQVREQPDGPVRVFIRHRGTSPGAA